MLQVLRERVAVGHMYVFHELGPQDILNVVIKRDSISRFWLLGSVIYLHTTYITYNIQMDKHTAIKKNVQATLTLKSEDGLAPRN